MIDSSATRIVRCRLMDMDSSLLMKWKDLYQGCVTQNPFLSPEFVMAYQQSLDPLCKAIVLAVEDRGSGRLLGLGVFESVYATKSLPFPHLVPYQAVHQYRDGLLVRAGCMNGYYAALRKILRQSSEQWSGIEFPKLRIRSEWVDELQRAAQSRSNSFRLTSHSSSPAVDLKLLHEEGLEHYWSKSRRKTMRRNRRKLEESGPLSFEIVDGRSPQFSEALKQFLQLEHSGWKGEAATSLASTKNSLQFVNAFSQLDGFTISRLKAGPRTVATAINLLTNRELYAFKIAWDAEFESASPGIVHEWELVNHVREAMPHLERIDSCSSSHSYLADLWPHSVQIGEGLLSVTSLGRGAGKMIHTLRALKNRGSN